MKFAAFGAIAAIVLGLVACSPKSGDKPASSSSGSHDPSGPISEARLGLQIYPGARIVTSGETDEIVSANLETADAPAKVAQFYQQQLGQSADANSMMVSGSKGGKTYAISITPSEGGSAVSIMGKK
jgi:hypothetical protein